MEFDVGDVIANKYELRRLLGEGGMGKVWLARHKSLEQYVAIKIMAPLKVDVDEDARTTLGAFRSRDRSPRSCRARAATSFA